MARNYSSVVEPKTLTADVTSVATQITLNNVTGLPSAPYVLVLNPDTVKEEAVLVTVDQSGVTSPTLKVERAIETSGGLGTAQTHSVGNTVKHMIVGSDLQIVHDHFSNDSTTTGTAHGATGGVVGRTNSQTLTNKTLTSPTVTDPTITGTITGAVITSANIVDGTIVNADINASAAIADTKLATISTTSKVSNSATTATSANTASAIVARDASGNFTAGTVTANLTGNVTGNVSGSSGSCTGNAATSSSTTGNAATATALQTTRSINGVSFNGTANIKTHDGGQGSAASSGVTQVGHNLGVTPSAVTVTMRTAGTSTGSPRIFYVSAMDSNSFDVRALDTAGVQQSGAFYWIAVV